MGLWDYLNWIAALLNQACLVKGKDIFNVNGTNLVKQRLNKINKNPWRINLLVILRLLKGRLVNSCTVYIQLHTYLIKILRIRMILLPLFVVNSHVLILQFTQVGPLSSLFVLSAQTSFCSQWHCTGIKPPPLSDPTNPRTTPPSDSRHHPCILKPKPPLTHPGVTHFDNCHTRGIIDVLILGSDETPPVSLSRRVLV